MSRLAFPMVFVLALLALVLVAGCPPSGDDDDTPAMDDDDSGGEGDLGDDDDSTIVTPPGRGVSANWIDTCLPEPGGPGGPHCSEAPPTTTAIQECH